MTDSALFGSPRSRVLAATLGVLLTSLLVTTGMVSYLPLRTADSITLPILLFPVTWCALFLWVLFEQRMWMVWGVLGTLSAIHLALILSTVGVV